MDRAVIGSVGSLEQDQIQAVLFVEEVGDLPRLAIAMPPSKVVTHKEPQAAPFMSQQILFEPAVLVWADRMGLPLVRAVGQDDVQRTDVAGLVSRTEVMSVNTQCSLAGRG